MDKQNLERQIEGLKQQYQKVRDMCQELADAYDGNDTDRVTAATEAIYNYIYPPAIGVSVKEGLGVRDKFGGD